MTSMGVTKTLDKQFFANWITMTYKHCGGNESELRLNEVIEVNKCQIDVNCFFKNRLEVLEVSNWLAKELQF